MSDLDTYTFMWIQAIMQPHPVREGPTSQPVERRPAFYVTQGSTALKYSSVPLGQYAPQATTACKVGFKGTTQWWPLVELFHVNHED